MTTSLQFVLGKWHKPAKYLTELSWNRLTWVDVTRKCYVCETNYTLLIQQVCNSLISEFRIVDFIHWHVCIMRGISTTKQYLLSKFVHKNQLIGVRFILGFSKEYLVFWKPPSNMACLHVVNVFQLITRLKVSRSHPFYTTDCSPGLIDTKQFLLFRIFPHSLFHYVQYSNNSKDILARWTV